MSPRRLSLLIRLVLAIAVAIGVGALVELARLPTDWRPLSLRTAVGGVVVLSLGGLGRLLFLPASRLLALALAVDEKRRALSRVAAVQDGDDSPRLRAAGWLLTGLASLVFAAAVAFERPRQTVEAASDQQAFVASAVELQQQGGLPALPRLLYSGEFVEANRHPLFIGHLSLFPTRESGQWLATLFGLLTLLTVGIGARRFAGPPAAGMAALLLAVNEAFVTLSCQCVCETLLTWLLSMAFLLAVETSRSTGLRQEPPSKFRRLWLASGTGACLGLAWLTKGTVLPLLPVTLGWLLLAGLRADSSSETTSDVAGDVAGHAAGDAAGDVTNGSSNSSSPRHSLVRDALARRVAVTAVCVLSGLLVASPLLVRNVTRYGSPVFNVNSWLLFEDTFTDPAMLAERQTLSAAAAAFANTHTPIEMMQRLARGSVWEVFIFVRSAGPLPFGEARVLFGLLLAVLAALGCTGLPRRAVVLPGLWVAISFPLLAWYVPIAAGDRFALPLLLPLLLLSGRGSGLVLGLLRRQAEPEK